MRFSGHIKIRSENWTFLKYGIKLVYNLTWITDVKTFLFIIFVKLIKKFVFAELRRSTEIEFMYAA